MSVFHVACVDGDLDRLGKGQLLHNPKFVASSPTIVQDLLQVDRVCIPQPFSRKRGGKRRCRWLEGTPAELAVRAGHFDCANLVLSVLLYRLTILAPWISKFRTCSKMVFAHKQDVLREVLAFVGSREWVHLKIVCQQTWINNMEALYALLAACLLGQADVVQAVLEMVSRDYFDNIDEEMKWREIVSRDNPIYCRDLIATVAAMGGERDCLKLVLDAFGNSISRYGLQEVWVCLMNPVWLWSVPQLHLCLDLLTQMPFFDGVKKLTCDFEKFLLYFSHLNDWFVDRDAIAAKCLIAGRLLPAESQVIAALEIALPKAIDMIHPDCIRRQDPSALFLRAIKDTRKLFGRDSALAKLMENFLINIMTLQGMPSILAGKEMARTLSQLDAERQQIYLAMLGQYKVLLTDPDKDTVALPNGCVLCHPLVSFVCGVRKPYLRILSELNLWTLLPYFSPRELYLTQEVLRRPRSSHSLCSTHAEERRRGRYPLLRCMKKKVPQMQRYIDEIRKGVSLRQLALMQVLRNLRGNQNALERVPMPGPIRDYFLLKGFLWKLGSER